MALCDNCLRGHDQQWCTNPTDEAEMKFRTAWERSSRKQLEKEIKSWQKRFDKHGKAYAWHGADATPPGCLADGDKISILKEILKLKGQH